jgi:hypothetical protein
MGENPSSFLGPSDRFFPAVHIGPTSNGDLKGRHPERPIRVEGMSTTGCCPVSRGDRSRHWLISTPVPCSPRHDASHLGFGGVGLLKVEPSRASWTQSARSEGEGCSRWPLGVRLLSDTQFYQGKLRDCDALGVIKVQPLFPPLHVGWLSRFRVLSQKACGTLTVL